MDQEIYIWEKIGKLADNYLELKKWGFITEEQATVHNGEYPQPLVIYKSKNCKIKIAFNEWYPPHQKNEFTLDVFYGRVIAAKENVMLFENEECHCWHNIVKIMHFLDGRSPEYAAQNLFSHNIISEFINSTTSETLADKHAEWEIRKHRIILEKYSTQLFNLFDIKQVEPWRNYSQFLSGIYDIRGRKPYIKPPLDKIC